MMCQTLLSPIGTCKKYIVAKFQVILLGIKIATRPILLSTIQAYPYEQIILVECTYNIFANSHLSLNLYYDT